MTNFVYETKLAALTELLEIEGVPDRWVSKIPYTTFLGLLSKDKYNLSELGMCAQSTVNFIRGIFPDKPKSSGKVCFFIFSKYGLKHCPECHHIYDRDCFHKHSNRADGLNIYCKDCFNKLVRPMRKEYEASRKAGKLLRTPLWANIDIIKDIYSKCPEGYHVDHIVPLQGELVSGLHVEYNLQYLTAEDNIKKSNNFIPA